MFSHVQLENRIYTAPSSKKRHFLRTVLLNKKYSLRILNRTTLLLKDSMGTTRVRWGGTSNTDGKGHGRQDTLLQCWCFNALPAAQSLCTQLCLLRDQHFCFSVKWGFLRLCPMFATQLLKNTEPFASRKKQRAQALNHYSSRVTTTSQLPRWCLT